MAREPKAHLGVKDRHGPALLRLSHRRAWRSAPQGRSLPRGAPSPAPTCRSCSRPQRTRSKSGPPQLRPCRRLPSRRSLSGSSRGPPRRRGSSRKFRTGLGSSTPSCGHNGRRLAGGPAGGSGAHRGRPRTDPLVALILRDLLHLLVHLLDVLPAPLFPLLGVQTGTPGLQAGPRPLLSERAAATRLHPLLRQACLQGRPRWGLGSPCVPQSTVNWSRALTVPGRFVPTAPCTLPTCPPSGVRFWVCTEQRGPTRPAPDKNPGH